MKKAFYYNESARRSVFPFFGALVSAHILPSHDRVEKIKRNRRKIEKKRKKCSESPTSSQEPSVRHKSARNSPSAAAVIAEPDKYSEVATLGDPDEIGSIASLSSINERLIEVCNHSKNNPKFSKIFSRIFSDFFFLQNFQIRLLDERNRETGTTFATS